MNELRKRSKPCGHDNKMLDGGSSDSQFSFQRAMRKLLSIYKEDFCEFLVAKDLMLCISEKDTGNTSCQHCQCFGLGKIPTCVLNYELLLYTCSGSTQQILLRSLIHSNGIGHVLKLDARDQSKLTGVMNTWHSLCEDFYVKKITVEDHLVVEKMHFRLVHGILYGGCFFLGNGFQFQPSVFNLSIGEYDSALKILKNTPLKVVFFHLLDSKIEGKRTIKGIQQRFRSQKFKTLTDVFSLVRQSLSTETEQQKICEGFQSSPESNVKLTPLKSSRWKEERLTHAFEVIFEILKASKGKKLTREKVRSIAQETIGDTGLLDTVLKDVENRVHENHIVRRQKNPKFKKFEFFLEPYYCNELHQPDSSTVKTLAESPQDSSNSNASAVLDPDMLGDLKVLHDALFKVYIEVPDHPLESEEMKIAQALQDVMDFRHFARDYTTSESFQQCSVFHHNKRRVTQEKKREVEALRVTCWLENRGFKNKVEATKLILELEHEGKIEGLQGNGKFEVPPEVVVINSRTTYAEMKDKFAQPFRETYRAMKNIKVLKVEEMEELFKGRPEHRPCTLENDTSDLEVTIHVDGIDEAELGNQETEGNCECPLKQYHTLE